jgi:hypothetical protein
LLSCSRTELPSPKPNKSEIAEDANQLSQALEDFKLSVQSAKQDSCDLACLSISEEQINQIIDMLQKYSELLGAMSLSTSCILTLEQANICKKVADNQTTSWVVSNIESAAAELFRSLEYLTTCTPAFKISATMNLVDSVANMLVLLEILMNRVPDLRNYVPNKLIKITSVLKYNFLDNK